MHSLLEVAYTHTHAWLPMPMHMPMPTLMPTPTPTPMPMPMPMPMPEQVLQPPVGAAAAEHGLLDYAKTMSMRPPSHTPSASEAHGVSSGVSSKPRQPVAGSSAQWVHDVINFSSQRDAQGYGAHQVRER